MSPLPCHVEGCFALYLSRWPIPGLITSPLRIALNSEYSVSTCPRVSRPCPFVSIIVSLALLFLLLFCFVIPFDISDFAFWGKWFRIRFLQFVPRGGSFFPPFPPVRQTTDWIGNRILFFLGGLL